LPKAHQTALACFALVWALSWLNQMWPLEKALHDSLTVIALIALYWADRRFRLPLSSWILVLAFLSLHEVAAQWLYSYVPYDHWTEELFGFRISDVFGWQRNHFDRLVHFAYGVCAAGVGYRFLLDRTRASARRAALRAVEIVLATSALYELFEWGIASLLAPGMAEAYNGQQGDIWDPHKDITLAVLGAVLTAGFLLLRTRTRDSRDQTDVSRD
jgi:putative membrane protein